MNNMHSYSIYKAQNKDTTEAYIGVTKNSINQRRRQHEYKSSKGSCHKFHEAICTYGPDAFEWEQIDTANSTDELAQKEKEYIIQYDSIANGYNSDSGGGIKKTVYQYDLKDGSLINRYDCLESAANAVSANKGSISRACLNINKTCKGFYWSYSPTAPVILLDERKKKVIKIDMKDNLKSEYNSVAEASRETGVSKSSIAKACRGERKTAGGYVWRYI